ncbi:Alpha/Beta hydrolase protein [Xylogone sp. PMI_703]|nr:Alpha/Beta hydrolase protein [Xylogone sp. PMI_703]
MRFSTIISSLFLAGSLVAARRSRRHVGLEDPIDDVLKKRQPLKTSKRSTPCPSPDNYLHQQTEKYAVNGCEIPEVDFNVGESYAGLLPISTIKNEPRQLFFWFFPSENPLAGDEILIWLNGGPGCSSLEGFLQENGPFLWQYGTLAPVPNPYTWVNLTNVVWVEQPVGTGFSQGTPNATNEFDVAAQFMGFWANFVELFGLQGRKVYIAGESYAGYYVPYIADAFLNSKNTTHFNLQSTMIYDPSTSNNQIQSNIPAVPFVDYWKGLHPFNDTYMDFLHSAADVCGYTEFLDTYLTFPPPGPFPTKMPGTDANGRVLSGCNLHSSIENEIMWINPCWDVYQVATTCPLLYDVLGFPGSFDYLPAGGEIYFNRSDVKRHINAPHESNWQECTNVRVFPHGDGSPPSGQSVLPGVIERSKRTVIAHGALDFILVSNGTLLMIQNMTWNGLQGFQSKPVDPFYVPYHNELSASTLAGSGVFGTTHTERGLTWVSVDLSGHMIPQYAPTAAYRMLEYLLGRIDSLTSTEPFTTDNVTQPRVALGLGTAPPV